ncbi:SDR family NAD(P)-dependent oxidoreductase [Rhizosaccharibacter radicis]|uniref:SDR family NAD(P)-dependent oxidoreductase n=1 Tax=Rhizosaccharibacter radicis TaxID=2782605 RepID=A0ABT1VTZ8_9PROT|nr:SDR family NAD(P)-dependent oxidoreductase [Acetobacteraceae bacterium KSS12]
MPHPVLVPGAVAVITGGASGIGWEAARRFLQLGLRVCIADLGDERLAAAAEKLGDAVPGAADRLMTRDADVSRPGDLRALEQAVADRFGGTDVLMNNAAVQPGSSVLDGDDRWDRVLAVNLRGVVHGTQIFAERMLARNRPGLIINTGSKQGITTPPGDPAYNVAKAGVKAFTEALQHELRERGSRIAAHLLIPGFVWTPLAAGNRTEKPAAAWTAEQTVAFMLDRLEAGDFYILCPDNDVSRRLDERRILWAAGDVVENRPPLSRWHPDYGDAFRRFADAGN